MSQITISSEEAKQDKLFYVVSNVIIINPTDATCLILKRSEREKVHPGKWAYPGGKLEHGDVEKLLIESDNEPIHGIENILGKLAEREAKEECGLTVNTDGNAIIKNKVFVRPDGVPVFLTVTTAEYTGGDVVLEEEAFSEYAWVSEEDLPKYELIAGTEKEIATALALYK